LADRLAQPFHGRAGLADFEYQMNEPRKTQNPDRVGSAIAITQHMNLGNEAPFQGIGRFAALLSATGQVIGQALCRIHGSVLCG